MLKKLTSGDQGSLRELGIGDADFPGLAVRARADGRGLAHVDEGMIDAS